MREAILILGAAGLALAIIMTAAWRMQRRTGNSGWIDVFWSFGVGAVAVIASLFPIGGSPWPQGRQLLVAGLVGFWSMRLGGHILFRTRKVDDDPRYRHLIEQWGADAASKLFWQLQSQAAVGLILVASIVFAARNPAPLLQWQDVAALLVFLAGAVGEAVADDQMRRFKQVSANRGKICDTGLWRWSRHPNYFSEWLCWLAYPLLAVDVSGRYTAGYLSMLAPICMYWVLVHVSGIPPLESHLMRTRGALFIEYRKRTSAFFPWPPG